MVVAFVIVVRLGKLVTVIVVSVLFIRVTTILNISQFLLVWMPPNFLGSTVNLVGGRFPYTKQRVNGRAEAVEDLSSLND